MAPMYDLQTPALKNLGESYWSPLVEMVFRVASSPEEMTQNIQGLVALEFNLRQMLKLTKHQIDEESSGER